MASDVTIRDDDLRELVYQVLEKIGYPDNYAQDVSDGLVEADLRGRSDEGTKQLAVLVERTKRGLVDPKAQPRSLATAPSAARLDAQNAPGIPMGTHGMSLAITKARTTGVGVVTMLNSTSYGMGALHSELAALAGTIGIAMSNGAPTMSIAIPGRDGTVAMSLDLEADGLGVGLAFAVEMLVGLLSGGAVGSEVVAALEDLSKPQRTSQLFMAIEWRHFLRQPDFEERLAAIAKAVGAGAVPGERGLAEAERRQQAGIALDRSTADALIRLANEHGVALPEALR